MPQEVTTQTEPTTPAVAAEPAPAPAVPEVEPAPAPEVTPTPASPRVEGPASKREAREGAREAGRTRGVPAKPVEEPVAVVEEPAKPAVEPAVAPAVEPAAKPEVEPGKEPAKEPAAAPVVEPGAEPAEPGTAPVEPKPAEPTEAIRVPIDPGHPIRAMGLDSITVKTPQEERLFKALLNGTYMRRQDVETRDGTIVQLQEKIARYEAGDAAQTKWEQTPGYKEHKERFLKLKELEGSDEVPVGTASEYWKGAATELVQLQDAEYQTRLTAMRAERYERDATEWKQEAWERANRLSEAIRRLPEFGRIFESATQSFNAELELGHYPELAGITNAYDRREGLHKAFTHFLNSRLVAEPAVRSAYAAMKKLEEGQPVAGTPPAADTRPVEQIEREAVEKFKQGVADTRREGPPHPLGNLASAVDRHPAAEPVGDETPPAGQSTQAFRRELKRGAREDARRRMAR